MKYSKEVAPTWDTNFLKTGKGFSLKVVFFRTVCDLIKLESWKAQNVYAYMKYAYEMTRLFWKLLLIFLKAKGYKMHKII